MFNHKARAIAGRPTIERITPEELALRIRRRRTRRIATLLVCSSLVASASYLGYQGLKAKIGASAAIPLEGILNVADLSWPDGSELNALIPAAGGQAGDASPCSDNDCGTTKGTTKIALETSLDAMALQQLAELAPQAGAQGGSNPDQGNGGNGGPSNMSWGNGPNFPGNPNGGGSPNFSNGPFNWNQGPGPSGPGPSPSFPHPVKPKPTPPCDPNTPNDPDCQNQQQANGNDNGNGNGNGNGGGNGNGNNLINPNGPNDDTCTHDCDYPVGDNGPRGEDPECDPTSVPEPATLALFGAALAALGLSRRRRMR